MDDGGSSAAHNSADTGRCRARKGADAEQVGRRSGTAGSINRGASWTLEVEWKRWNISE